jgi:hypothetical protein
MVAQNTWLHKITYLSKYKSMAPHRCQYCGKAFNSLRAVNHHTLASKVCYKEWRKDLLRKENPSPQRPRRNSSTKLEDIVTGIADDFVMPPQVPPKRASVEDDEDYDGGNTYRMSKGERFIEYYLGDAGKGLRKSKTRFEVWLENQREEEKNLWDPFASEQEWALTMWLLKNVGQTSTDEFLKLPIVSKLWVAAY